MTRKVHVGDVIELQRRKIDVDPLGSYEEIGIRSFGRGTFHKEPVSGASLGNKRIFEIRPGDLVFNNVFAWEGAVALATQTEEGKCGSHRFLTYTARNDDVDLAFLRFFFVSEPGLALLGVASPGSAGRNRTLAIGRFESLEIPLPDLAEQRRIVVRLEGLLGATSSAVEFIRRAINLDNALMDSVVDAILAESSRAGWPSLPLREVAIVNPPPSPTEGPVAFVPMSAVDEKLGKIADPEIRQIEEIKTGYKQFRRGDVIFARITPCMQNGKSAVVEVDGVEYGYGSTEFHVLRPSNKLLPEWLHRVVRSRGFRERAMQAFTGTAGQQRVPAGFLQEARITVPPIEDQRRLVAHIDRVLGLGDEVRRKRELELERATALSSSVLNSGFTGLL